MPQKNKVKVYIEDGYYHVYNRGVEKRKIFLDDLDYRVFLHLLKYYLSPPKPESLHPLANLTPMPGLALKRPRPLKNLNKEVELLAYCLMPNHFHLLIKQKTIDGMTKLIRSLSTTYAMYFNRKYDRVGYLFQGPYKAANIQEDPYLLHLSRYIHLNPVELTGTDPVSYPYSSYPYYLNKKRAEWIKPDFILSFFDRTHKPLTLNKFSTYKKFVEEYNQSSAEILGNLTIE